MKKKMLIFLKIKLQRVLLCMRNSAIFTMAIASYTYTYAVGIVDMKFGELKKNVTQFRVVSENLKQNSLMT